MKTIYQLTVYIDRESRHTKLQKEDNYPLAITAGDFMRFGDNNHTASVESIQHDRYNDIRIIYLDGNHCYDHVEALKVINRWKQKGFKVKDYD